MYAVVNNGRVIRQLRPGASFVHPTSSVQYAAGWWRNTSVAQKAAISIYPIVEGPKADTKYYTNTAGSLAFDAEANQVNKPYTSTVRDLDGLKAVYDINSTAYNILKATDWHIVREIETSTPADGDVLDFRAAVRAKANDLEVQLEAVTDLDGLKAFAVDFIFPALSDYPLPVEPVEPVTPEDTDSDPATPADSE